MKSTVCGLSPAAPLAVGPYRCYIGCREAASRVRSHISPGPYRSFRELSLAGSVDPDIWCPPTFVGNSGIECFNGVCGFALLFARYLRLLPACIRHTRESGYPVRRGFSGQSPKSLEYWIIRTTAQLRTRRMMTAEQDMTATLSKADLRAAALAKRDGLGEEQRAAAAQAMAKRGLPF